MNEQYFFTCLTLAYMAYFLTTLWLDRKRVPKAGKPPAADSFGALTYREDNPPIKASHCYPPAQNGEPKEDAWQPPAGQGGAAELLTMKQYYDRAREEAERFTRSVGF